MSVKPVEIDAVFLDPDVTVMIEGHAVDGSVLAKAHRPEGECSEECQRKEDGRLSYEDVKTFCSDKGISECLTTPQYNRLAKSLTYTGDMGAKIALRRFLQGRMSSESNFDVDEFFRLTGDLLADSELNFEQICSRLDLKQSDVIWRSSASMYQMLLEYVEKIVDAMPSEVRLSKEASAGIDKLILGILTRLSGNDGPGESSDYFSDVRRYAQVASAIAVHLGLDGAKLLRRFSDSFKTAGLRKDDFFKAIVQFSVRYPIHGFLNSSPKVRGYINSWFRDESLREGNFRQWLLLNAGHTVEDLRFMMKAYVQLPHGMKLKRIEQFVEVWAEITSTPFSPAHQIQDEIDAFNCALMMASEEIPSNQNATILDGEGRIEHGGRLMFSATRPELSIFLPAAEHLSCSGSQEILGRALDVFSAYEDSAKSSQVLNRLIGPLRQYLSMADDIQQYKANVASIVQTLIASQDGDVAEKTMRVVQAAAPTMAEPIRAEILKVIAARLEKIKGGRDVGGLSYARVYDVTLLVETALKLGGDFEDFAEDYSRIEKRLYGYTYSSEHQCGLSEEVSSTYRSFDGFLGCGGSPKTTDRLIRTIESDRSLLSSMGFKAEQVAEPLQIIRDYRMKARLTVFAIEINGRVYDVDSKGPIWGQGCPFLDSSDNAQPDFIVTDRETGKTFFFAGLLPHLISAHHFFEGKNAGTWGGSIEGRDWISYRVEPKEVIEFFRLRPDEFSARPVESPRQKLSRD